MVCKNCQSDISQNQERFCYTCGNDIGFPHIREVSQKNETDALYKRYNTAVNVVKSSQKKKSLDFFESCLEKAFAVINVKLDYLHQFVKDDKKLYSNYDLQLKGQTRKIADLQDDRNRSSAGGSLFGSNRDQYRYAALAINGTGLKSYGSFTIKLRNDAIIHRSVLLEENSYDFIKKHCINIDKPIPLGYRAKWEDKSKLAVAKLIDDISQNMTEEDCAEIVLFSEGDYKTDKFIEIHIYGSFDNKAIDSVVGDGLPTNKLEVAMLEVVKDYLIVKGKAWIEE